MEVELNNEGDEKTMLGKIFKKALGLFKAKDFSADIDSAKTLESKVQRLSAMLGRPWTLLGARRVLDNVNNYPVKKILKAIEKLKNYQHKDQYDFERLRTVLEHDVLEVRRKSNGAWIEIDGENWQINAWLNDLYSKDSDKKKMAVKRIAELGSINHVLTNKAKLEKVVDGLFYSLVTFEVLDSYGSTRHRVYAKDSLATMVYERDVEAGYLALSIPISRNLPDARLVIKILISLGWAALVRLQDQLEKKFEEAEDTFHNLIYEGTDKHVTSRLKFEHKADLIRAIEQLKKNDTGRLLLVDAAYYGLDYFFDKSSREQLAIAKDWANSNGRTPIMQASRNGHLEIVETLIEIGALIDKQDNEGNTSLMLASKRGHFDVVKMLLGKGAYIDLQNKEGKTALDYALDGGHTNIVNILKSAVAVGSNVTDPSVRMELFDAASEGDIGKVKLLIEKGANVNLQDNDGKTVLMKASSKGHANIVTLLLEKGVDVNLQDNDGKTALIIAALKKNYDVMILLLKKGGDSTLKDNDGKSAMDYQDMSDRHRRFGK